MLKEWNNIKQHPNEPLRRWFFDDFFDLITWHDEKNSIVEFELCYDKGHSQRVFRWCENNYSCHMKVDEGECHPLNTKMSPIYVTDGLFDTSVIARFRKESLEVDEDIRSFVVNILSEY